LSDLHDLQTAKNAHPPGCTCGEKHPYVFLGREEQMKSVDRWGKQIIRFIKALPPEWLIKR